jgi:hypothetical protein
VIEVNRLGSPVGPLVFMQSLDPLTEG